MSDLIDGKTGLKTVVREEFSSADPVPGKVRAHQLPLLPLDTETDDTPNGADTGSPSRGAGRPPGSKNKSTEEWRTFLLSRYSAPLIALAEVYNRKPQDIAIEFGLVDHATGKCTATFDQLFDILKIQLQCAKELAPYLHQKQPMAIEAGEKGLISLVFQSAPVTQQQVDEAGTMSVNFIDAETIDNQGLTAIENSNSVAADSVTNAQGIDTTQHSPQRQTD